MKHSFNRTIVELKRQNATSEVVANGTFNRTIVELKPKEMLNNTTQIVLLIVP